MKSYPVSDSRYREQQAFLNELAIRHGLVTFRPEYHAAHRDCKQFKKLGSCGDCKHWHEETAYCRLNSYFVDHDGLCCSPAESPNWTMWEKDEFCSRFERREDDAYEKKAD